MRLAIAALTCALLLAASADAKLRSCGRIQGPDGTRELVRAHAISCTRAKQHARGFVVNRTLPKSYTAVNPAGCEWLLFPRRHRRAVERASRSKDGRLPSGVPVVFTTRTVGCES